MGADQLPSFLADSRPAELLEGVCETPHHGESEPMPDTHAVTRSLTAADFTPAQADALTVRPIQGGPRAEIAEVRAERRRR